MSAKEYDLLKKRNRAAGLSASAWLMRLETNRPVLFREAETREAIAFMNEAGREINAIARDFNSGYGTAEQLQYAVRRLSQVYRWKERKFGISILFPRCGKRGAAAPCGGSSPGLIWVKSGS